MARISRIDYDTAPPEIRAAHDEELRLRGRMTNMKRILLHSPAAHRIYAEWFTLRATCCGLFSTIAPSGCFR